MSDPFLGQVQIFGFDFAPKQWARCSGQMMNISQSTALFSLLGTVFGGDGKTTFGLPNFQGTAVCGIGQGPGLTPRISGETFGTETVSLISTEMPAHNHTMNVFGQNTAAKRHGTPNANDALVSPTAGIFTAGGSVSGTFPIQTIGVAGGGLPHENRQPYLALNFCIALSGVYPSRT